jgi:hypothetical protein
MIRQKCLIDTGCSCNLIIPERVAKTLDLPFLGNSKITLGDNKTKDSKDYACVVAFNSLCEHADFKTKVTVFKGNETWIAGLGIIDLFCNLNKARFVIDVVKDEIRFETDKTNSD